MAPRRPARVRGVARRTDAPALALRESLGRGVARSPGTGQGQALGMPGELISREALERIIPRAAALQASERSGTPEMAHRRCCGPRYEPPGVSVSTMVGRAIPLR